MKEIKILDAKKMSKKTGYPEIIIFGNDPVSGIQHITTYGKTKNQCLEAAKLGNKIKKYLNWPDKLCNSEPDKNILDNKPD